MTHSQPADRTTPRPAEDKQNDSEREDERERRRVRQWRIAATQLAAPPARTWRRAGRFR